MPEMMLKSDMSKRSNNLNKTNLEPRGLPFLAMPGGGGGLASPCWFQATSGGVRRISKSSKLIPWLSMALFVRFCAVSKNDEFLDRQQFGQNSQQMLTFGRQSEKTHGRPERRGARD